MFPIKYLRLWILFTTQLQSILYRENTPLLWIWKKSFVRACVEFKLQDWKDQEICDVDIIWTPKQELFAWQIL